VPGNPIECREHAKRCLEMAAQASSQLAKAQLEDLAQTWMRLASDLDRTKALLATWGAIEDGSKADENPA
jgi:hypothetical protein